MIDSKISCVLTEPTLRIFSENTSGWLQLKKKKQRYAIWITPSETSLSHTTTRRTEMFDKYLHPSYCAAYEKIVFRMLSIQGKNGENYEVRGS